MIGCFLGREKNSDFIQLSFPKGGAMGAGSNTGIIESGTSLSSSIALLRQLPIPTELAGTSFYLEPFDA